MRFVHYPLRYVRRHGDLPGMERFGKYCHVAPGIMPIDRTGMIKFPVRTKSLFPLPKMREFTRTYEEVCDARAQELLARAGKLNTSIYVFWSGGVDSTTVLISLLKNATAAQKKRIVVLLSEGSIGEYPAFYRDHIRGKLQRQSVMLFPYVFGSNNLIVTGEHNDQLFGSDLIGEAINRFGFDKIIAPYDRRLFAAFFAERMEDHQATILWVQLYERLKDAAPVELRTNFDMFWWFNFAVKWQTVYARTLSFAATRNLGKITAQWLKDYYAPFFGTKEFQLWSMNNLDKRIKDSWRTYKWPAKDVVYKFTKDEAYRDSKIKRGSLQFLFWQLVPHNFISEKFEFYEEIDPVVFYEPDNDFVRPAASAPLTWSESVDALRPQM